MAPKELWLVTRVFGKNRENVELLLGNERKLLKNALIKDIAPGNYVALEGNLIIEVMSERAAESRMKK